MEPLALDRARLGRILEAACEQLEGDWVLLGGAVAALCFSPERVTEDIDLVPLHASGVGSDARRYALMDFALAQGLPLEAVNSAADFFLRREAGFEDDLELLRAGARARVFRPTPTLFVLLKCGRMSESDLSDCLAQLTAARREGVAIDVPRIRARLEALRRAETGDPARARRERLGDALSAL
ncbi:MAG TPA: hypothetical protein PLR99_18550 [Polyangiaceae bacterium]|nr:hypothetical protein [Polyangiaceae bacterium]